MWGNALGKVLLFYFILAILFGVAVGFLVPWLWGLIF